MQLPTMTHSHTTSCPSWRWCCLLSDPSTLPRATAWRWWLRSCWPKGPVYSLWTKTVSGTVSSCRRGLPCAVKPGQVRMMGAHSKGSKNALPLGSFCACDIQQGWSVCLSLWNTCPRTAQRCPPPCMWQQKLLSSPQRGGSALSDSEKLADAGRRAFRILTARAGELETTRVINACSGAPRKT